LSLVTSTTSGVVVSRVLSNLIDEMRQVGGRGDVLFRARRGALPSSSEFEAQRSALANASSIAAELNKTTWLERAEEMDHVQHPFIFILLAWFAILFFSIGLFAPRNGLVIAALVVGALSIAGAVVLIADLDSPFEGILVVSAEPMQEALARISAP
jgi:hypothetical protein